MTVDGTEPPVGLSVWERELYDHLLQHIELEHTVLDEYEALAATAGGHVGYLLRLIGDDEKRHHALFQQWAAALRGMAALQEVPEGLPFLQKEDDPEAVLHAVERLLAIEHDDGKELRKLRKDVSDVEDTTLWGLVVELMRLDTEKHIRILEFLRRHARQTLKDEHS
jgi:rubrerythrin